MNKPFIEIDAEHFILSAFETKPIEGYEAPINKETGEQFPNCCPFHKSVFEGATSWFLKFPNCCDQHKAMVSKWWYDKANYSGIAEKIVKQLSYTEHHISERINTDDWYKDITDYIEYNVLSFGRPAIGLHLYLGNLQHYIKNTESEIPEIKRQALIEFIETYYKNPKEHTKTDLNVLYSTYQKWLKVFPFEISFFANLKPHLEKHLPILNGEPETNKYTGLAKAKMHTKDSLIDVLLNLTNNILTQINTTTLYEKGLLTEPQKIKLELVLNERKMKLKQGYVNNSKDEEQRYRKILKEWFADEKRFIDEITPLVKALPPQPIENTKETEDTPKTFEELFYNTDLVAPSIDILKELDPPVIDTDCNYIGKLKGIICVWIDELQRQGIVKHYSDRKIFASLIPQKIKRFSIDESMFGKYQGKAENNYRTDIKTKVSKIKLSQNSH